MGYEIHDIDGYVAQGPSLQGWKELREGVLIPHGGSATYGLVFEGFTEDVSGLGAELSKMTGSVGPVASSLDALRAAVDHAKEIVILASGVTDGVSAGDLEIDKAYLV